MIRPVAIVKIPPFCLKYSIALRSFSFSILLCGSRVPSKSVIREDFNPAEIAVSYENAGADAVSCLTEEYYFKGSSSYLREIRKKINLPILRKDFIFDEYQIYEARTLGADAVLLIAAALDTDTMKNFSAIAESLNMNCLFEAHNEEKYFAVLQKLLE